jgi:hypothetical protein
MRMNGKILYADPLPTVFSDFLQAHCEMAQAIPDYPAARSCLHQHALGRLARSTNKAS